MSQHSFQHCLRSWTQSTTRTVFPGQLETQWSKIRISRATRSLPRRPCPLFASSTTRTSRSTSFFFPRPATTTTTHRFYSQQQQDIREAQVVRESKGAGLLQQQQENETERLERLLTQCLERYEATLDTDDMQRQREALYELRSVYEDLSYWDQALAVEGVIEAEHVENDLELAATLFRQGKLHARMQEWVQANQHYQQSLALFKQELGEVPSPQVGNLLLAMAGVHFHRGRMDEALNVLKESEEQFVSMDTKVPFHCDFVKCVQHQGLVHRTLNDFESALTEYERAFEALEDLGPGFCEGFDARKQGLELDIADMMAALDRHEDAIKAYQTILDQDKQRNLSDEETLLDGVILHNVGKIRAAAFGEHERAIDELSRALDIKQRLVGENHPEVAKTLNVLGAVHAVTENRLKALECFQHSLLIARMYAGEDGDQDPNVMYALRNIAVLKGEKVAKWDDETN